MAGGKSSGLLNSRSSITSHRPSVRLGSDKLDVRGLLLWNARYVVPRGAEQVCSSLPEIFVELYSHYERPTGMST